MFFAHYVAGWLGVPSGLVIVAMLVLRRRGMAALRARRRAGTAGR